MTVAELLRKRFADIDEAEEIGVPVDELVSLVEAAERVDADERPKVRVSELNSLVALRLSLTALREHLEGGDE